MEINLGELHDINLIESIGTIPSITHRSYWLSQEGLEHYKLLAYISNQQVSGTRIADLGSREGMSAMALSYNPGVEVISYDITLERIFPKIRDISNIKFIESDVFLKIEEILSCGVILIDIDPHDGKQEQMLYNIFKDQNYKGLTIWDDIHLNDGMNRFWDNVDLIKQDVTALGHHSGTGIIEFV